MAVIAFGDLTAGDPATWVRARGWALNLATAIGAFSGDNPRMAAISVHGAAQVRREP